MNRNQFNLVRIYEETLQIFTHYFICVYRSLNRIGKLQKPDSDLTDIFWDTYSYYDHEIME